MSQIIKYLQKWFVKITFAYCLGALAQLQRAYFACYLRRDYLAKQSDYEKIFYQKRSILLNRMKYARYFLKKNSEKWRLFFSEIEHLSEIIFSLNQLRFRVTDYTIFEICAFEMQWLSKTSTSALKSAANSFLKKYNSHSHLVALSESIEAFETISHSALQITSQEPIVFLFFIQDLYALHDAVKKLYEKTN